MKGSLDFKIENSKFQMPKYGVEQSKGLCKSLDSERLIEQKKQSSLFREKEKRKSKRWEKVVEFAQNHQTVLPEECKNFYRNHPEEFMKDQKESVDFMGKFGILSLFFMGATVPGFVIWSMLGQVCSLVFIALAALCAIGFVLNFNDWVNGKRKGIKGTKLKAWAFLAKFKRDKNLKELWCKKKHENKTPEELCRRKFKKDEKEWSCINAYVETKDWLQKWSRGDVNNLRWVEWKALYGISKKYEKYLTPVNKSSNV